MTSKISSSPAPPGLGWLRFGLPLLALLPCGNAWGDYQDIDVTNCAANAANTLATYAGTANTPIPTADGQIGFLPTTVESVFWNFNRPANCAGSDTGNKIFTCNTLTITLPEPQDTNPSAKKVIVTGTPTTGGANFDLLATSAQNTSQQCTGHYFIRVTSTGGGWGDPHITTVDGINYDFQSAGEFAALRGDGLEVQTRQTPVATTPAIPPNAYTGLSSCVSIYTAVAARVGPHRVTYQPNISGVPDPSGLQLRVDGVLTTLGPEGIDLDSGPIITAPTPGAVIKQPSAGRIVKSPTGGGMEIHYLDGTKLVVTPAWWDAQQKWYLNVNVYETTATEGIMGMIAKRGWLPALPDGTSLGPKPEALHDRYVHLYEKFADAWRVTVSTSLFDYAPGTSTQTFTNRNWPGENPSSCAIEGEPTAQPIDVHLAEQHCSAVADKNNRANCIFDVSVTGYPGFAQTYQTSEQLHPGLTQTAVKDDRDPSSFGDTVSFTATVVPTLSRGIGAPGGNVQFVLNGGKVGDPVTLDSSGRATWSSSNLQSGEHQVVANYIPSRFGAVFLASSSPEESHTVIAAQNFYLWLIILLIIILLIVLIIWRYLRTT